MSLPSISGISLINSQTSSSLPLKKEKVLLLPTLLPQPFLVGNERPRSFSQQSLAALPPVPKRRYSHNFLSVSISKEYFDGKMPSLCKKSAKVTQKVNLGTQAEFMETFIPNRGLHRLKNFQETKRKEKLSHAKYHAVYSKELNPEVVKSALFLQEYDKIFMAKQYSQSIEPVWKPKKVKLILNTDRKKDSPEFSSIMTSFSPSELEALRVASNIESFVRRGRASQYRHIWSY
jgi:hypothetical protein